MEAVVGQLAELVWRNDDGNANWCYCVVEHIFDDRIQFLKDDGRRYMHVLNGDQNEGNVINNQHTKSSLIMLYRNGNPVMARKKLFGGYKVTPQ